MHLPTVLGFAALATALAPPNCSQVAAPAQKTLTQVRTATLNVSGPPFGVVYASKQPHTAFVVLSTDTGGILDVLDTSAFAPRLKHQITLPANATGNNPAYGLTLTNDGEHLLVSAGAGAVVVDAARAAAGSPAAVVGVLNGTLHGQTPGNASIQITVSPDDRYAFISQEYGPAANIQPGEVVAPGNVDVIRLDGRGASGTPLGNVTLGFEVVGTALSRDARTLFATSEQASVHSLVGFISALDVATLERDPSASVLSNVSAGCSPVRAILSDDGNTLWVTARASNSLLAFDAKKIVSDPDNALKAVTQVGSAPVGLVMVDGGKRVLTADSNRFNYTGATTGVSVVDVDAALAGKHNATLGRIPTGLFPREFALSPDGKTLLLGDYGSNQIQAIDVASLP